ncbi:MIA40 [[Candida] subhashii]|uniref:Mitochondrial intermembrane space import and assembly protein 40 n=1 Tax=[Candida] subhashii TaxID=561895 RepID=A0A8J5QK88_9ASCO|nr:MIA40 [[Candida] subhashii]KAG7664617.1 MIA40 [[Candida] subhashii]
MYRHIARQTISRQSSKRLSLQISRKYTTNTPPKGGNNNFSTITTNVNPVYVLAGLVPAVIAYAYYSQKDANDDTVSNIREKFKDLNKKVEQEKETVVEEAKKVAEAVSVPAVEPVVEEPAVVEEEPKVTEEKIAEVSEPESILDVSIEEPIEEKPVAEVEQPKAEETVVADVEEPKQQSESEPQPETESEVKQQQQPEGEEPKEGEAAFNPETGEINWDCPCLGGMAHGPCGEEFKEAFSCFVFSETEPKGIDCITKFENMRSCFKRYPEHYKDELYEEGEEELQQQQGQVNTEAVAAVEAIEPVLEEVVIVKPTVIEEVVVNPVVAEEEVSVEEELVKEAIEQTEN